MLLYALLRLFWSHTFLTVFWPQKKHQIVLQTVQRLVGTVFLHFCSFHCTWETLESWISQVLPAENCQWISWRTSWMAKISNLLPNAKLLLRTGNSPVREERDSRTLRTAVFCGLLSHDREHQSYSEMILAIWSNII